MENRLTTCSFSSIDTSIDVAHIDVYLWQRDAQTNNEFNFSSLMWQPNSNSNNIKSIHVNKERKWSIVWRFYHSCEMCASDSQTRSCWYELPLHNQSVCSYWTTSAVSWKDWKVPPAIMAQRSDPILKQVKLSLIYDILYRCQWINFPFFFIYIYVTRVFKWTHVSSVKINAYLNYMLKVRHLMLFSCTIICANTVTLKIRSMLLGHHTLLGYKEHLWKDGWKSIRRYKAKRKIICAYLVALEQEVSPLVKVMTHL